MNEQQENTAQLFTRQRGVSSTTAGAQILFIF